MENTVLTSCTLNFIYTIEVFDDWMIIIEEVEESTNPFTYWFYPKSELEKLLNIVSFEEFAKVFDKSPREIFNILKDNGVHAKYIL